MHRSDTDPNVQNGVPFKWDGTNVALANPLIINNGVGSSASSRDSSPVPRFSNVPNRAAGPIPSSQLPPARPGLSPIVAADTKSTSASASSLTNTPQSSPRGPSFETSTPIMKSASNLLFTGNKNNNNNNNINSNCSDSPFVNVSLMTSPNLINKTVPQVLPNSNYERRNGPHAANASTEQTADKPTGNLLINQKDDAQPTFMPVAPLNVAKSETSTSDDNIHPSSSSHFTNPSTQGTNKQLSTLGYHSQSGSHISAFAPVNQKPFSQSTGNIPEMQAARLITTPRPQLPQHQQRFTNPSQYSNPEPLLQPVYNQQTTNESAPSSQYIKSTNDNKQLPPGSTIDAQTNRPSNITPGTQANLLLRSAPNNTGPVSYSTGIQNYPGAPPSSTVDSKSVTNAPMSNKNVIINSGPLAYNTGIQTYPGASPTSNVDSKSVTAPPTSRTVNPGPLPYNAGIQTYPGTSSTTNVDSKSVTAPPTSRTVNPGPLPYNAGIPTYPGGNVDSKSVTNPPTSNKNVIINSGTLPYNVGNQSYPGVNVDSKNVTNPPMSNKNVIINSGPLPYNAGVQSYPGVNVDSKSVTNPPMSKNVINPGSLPYNAGIQSYPGGNVDPKSVTNPPMSNKNVINSGPLPYNAGVQSYPGVNVDSKSVTNPPMSNKNVMINSGALSYNAGVQNYPGVNVDSKSVTNPPMSNKNVIINSGPLPYNAGVQNYPGAPPNSNADSKSVSSPPMSNSGPLSHATTSFGADTLSNNSGASKSILSPPTSKSVPVIHTNYGPNTGMPPSSNNPGLKSQDAPFVPQNIIAQPAPMASNNQQYPPNQSAPGYFGPPPTNQYGVSRPNVPVSQFGAPTSMDNLRSNFAPPKSDSMAQYASNVAKRYPQPQYPNQPYRQNAPNQTYQQGYTQGVTQGMTNMNLQQTGFNRIWGGENFDLLQCPNVLPTERIEAPRVCLGQEYLNQANCSQEIFRCTMTKIPETHSLLQKSRLPLGVLIHPFKDLNHLPVIQCSTIVRCRACRTYINPFVFFVDTKRWKCNLCYRVNELPEEFQYDPVSKSYGDPSRRPEIKSSTIEYIAPSEYMLRPPQPAVYLFLLDISRLAVESGYLHTVCEVLSGQLASLPGDSRTQIGFIAYNSTLHFFSLGEGLSQPHEMTVLDIDDVFLPCPDNLLVNLKERMELVTDLLTLLPTRYINCYDNGSALGSALQAAFKMMSATGGRITVFQATLPTLGPGALTVREDPNQRAGKEAPHLNPATDFYKRLALECSGHQVAVDLFIINSQYVDIATLWECAPLDFLMNSTSRLIEISMSTMTYTRK